MSDKTGCQFEEYWRTKISDDLWAQAELEQTNGDTLRACWLRIAATEVLRPLYVGKQKPSYETEWMGRPL